MITIQEKYDDPNIIKPMFKFNDDSCELTRQALDYLGKPKFIEFDIYKDKYLVIKRVDGRTKNANRVDYSMGAGIWRSKSKDTLENVLIIDKHIAVGQLSEVKIRYHYEKCLLFKTK